MKNSTIEALLINCTKIIGLVQILGTADPVKLDNLLSTVEFIEGCLFISNTNLKNLNFLRNLKEVNCTSATVQQPGVIAAIFIDRNEDLLSFGIGNLKNVTMTPPPDMDLDETIVGSVIFLGNTHLCLTYDEFNSLSYLPLISLTEIPMCPTPKPPLPACYVTPDLDVDKSCELFVGIVFIDETTEPEDVAKISKMKQLYGQFSVRDSLIEELILPNLTLIVNTATAEMPAILVLQNSALKTLSFPKLTEFRGDSPFFDLLLSDNPSLNFSCEAVFPADKTAVVLDESGFLCSNGTSSLLLNNEFSRPRRLMTLIAMIGVMTFLY
ncbi:unnamed protein product [Caenorhabditis auriculariae]|uniref:Receptor L-domain domain-containing protein n=1 Tax=Caenorhabditis auriculariae TaxID=2777116 RepID=A0A8S1HEC5_9PELO|nr:unnamed protein product [Caenorhabditis auriculariae]